MKKVSLLKPLLLLFALIVGSSSVWADDITYTFSSKTWEATAGGDAANWTSGKDGNGFTAGQGVQVTTSVSGANATSPTSFSNISQIVVTYNTNKSGGAGNIKIKIGENDETSKAVAYAGSGDGRSAHYTATFSYTTTQTGTVKLTVETTTNSIWIESVKITYGVAPVSVTGVTVDPTSLSIPVGESETLTATVAPAEASNKNVTWSSNKESVATVVDGVVTGVSEGTATITVTTEDGGKTATCDVTVTAAPTAVVTLDFTSNTWGFPEGTKTEGTNDYTYGGYTITLVGPSGNGYYYDTAANNLLIGKKDATVTLPAFAFNVKRIKVYGAEGAAGDVTFNVFVGDDAVSTQVTSSKVTQTFDIAADKQAEGTIYVIKVTNAKNMRISKIEVFGTKNVTIASSGYSTLASAYALDFANATPAGLEAYVASSVTASGVDLSAVTEAPASTGVILKGTAGTEYTIPFKASAAAVGTNKLHAAVTAYDCAANEVYILKDGLFHLVTGASTVPAGKAYLLASDVPSGARELTFNFGDETAIRSLTPTLTEGEGVWYDLSGRRVENPTKGIYIINGKKVIFK